MLKKGLIAGIVVMSLVTLANYVLEVRGALRRHPILSQVRYQGFDAGIDKIIVRDFEFSKQGWRLSARQADIKWRFNLRKPFIEISRVSLKNCYLENIIRKESLRASSAMGSAPSINTLPLIELSNCNVNYQTDNTRIAVHLKKVIWYKNRLKAQISTIDLPSRERLRNLKVKAEDIVFAGGKAVAKVKVKTPKLSGSTTLSVSRNLIELQNFQLVSKIHGDQLKLAFQPNSWLTIDTGKEMTSSGLISLRGTFRSKLFDQHWHELPVKSISWQNFDLKNLSGSLLAVLGQKNAERPLKVRLAISSNNRNLNIKLENSSFPCSSFLSFARDAFPERLSSFSASGSVNLGFSASIALSSPLSLNSLNLSKVLERCSFRSNSKIFSRESLIHRIFVSDMDTISPKRQHYLLFEKNKKPFYKEPNQKLRQLLIASEDRRFYRHKGVDYIALKAAAYRNLAEADFTVGASTLTMQLSRSLFLETEKTLGRKLQEIVLARYLEQILTKKEILNLYEEVVEFGKQIYGVSAASQTYFAKRPNHLTTIEAAFLVAALPHPIAAFRSYCQRSLTRSVRARMLRVLDNALPTYRDLPSGQKLTLIDQLEFQRDAKDCRLGESLSHSRPDASKG